MKKITSIVLLCAMFSCAEKKVDVKADEEKIKEAWRDWPKQDASGDVEKAAIYWGEDAMVMGYQAPTVQGKKQVMEMIDGLKKNPGFKIEWDSLPISIHVSKDGQMAWLIAHNKFSIADSTGKQLTTSNKAIQVWEKNANDEWRLSVTAQYPEPAQ